jgi:methylamine utilization protein MauE
MRSADLYLDVTSTVAACLISLVLVRALLHKVSRPAELTGVIRNYRLVPHGLVPLTAVAVVVCEACAALGLVLPQTRAPAALLACALLLIYAAAMGINLLRGRTNINCGCGGAAEGISGLHVLRNLALALCAMAAIASGTARAPTGFELSAVTAGCVLAVWFMFLAFDQLLGNRTHAGATRYSSVWGP